MAAICAKRTFGELRCPSALGRRQSVAERTAMASIGRITPVGRTAVNGRTGGVPTRRRKPGLRPKRTFDRDGSSAAGPRRRAAPAEPWPNSMPSRAPAELLEQRTQGVELLAEAGPVASLQPLERPIVGGERLLRLFPCRPHRRRPGDG